MHIRVLMFYDIQLVQISVRIPSNMYTHTHIYIYIYYIPITLSVFNYKTY